MTLTIHPGAKQISPRSQGQLDSLCGLYALINAIRVLHAPNHRITSNQCELLFEAGIDALAAKLVSKSLAFGAMTVAEQGKLARILIKSPALEGLPGVSVRPSLPRIKTIDDLDELLFEALSHGEIFLTCLLGRRTHHSVIVGATSSRIMLFDSAGMQFVYKTSLRFDDARSGALTITGLTPVGLRILPT